MKKELFIKIHRCEQVTSEKISLDIEGLIIEGDYIVRGQPVEIEMNGKFHRLAAMDNGRFRTELIFPVVQGERQRLKARILGQLTEVPDFSIEIVPPDYESYLLKHSAATSKWDTSLPLILSGKRVVMRGDSVTFPTGIYEATSDIHVERGGRLIIEKGVTIEFTSESGIICEGILEVRGDKENPVTFTARQAHWRNVLLFGRYTDGTRLQFCTIEKGTGRSLKRDDVSGTYVPETISEALENCNGGGIQCIYTHHSDIVLEHVTLRENYARNGKGGGVYLEDASAVIRFSEILQNQSDGVGGGVYICGHGSVDAKFLETGIIGNKSKQEGGGIYLESVSPEFMKLNLIYNEAHFGGALYHNNVKPEQLRLNQCSIKENVSLDDGEDTEGICGDWNN